MGVMDSGLKCSSAIISITFVENGVSAKCPDISNNSYIYVLMTQIVILYFWGFQF